MTNTMTESLLGLRRGMPSAVREVETLRVAADFPLSASEKDLSEARNQILRWAERRIGGKLPQPAWDGVSFEHLTGGRAAMATRVISVEADIWAIQVNGPDENVPGRTWTTEVSIGWRAGDGAKLGLRLLVTTGEDQLEIDPAVPGLLQQLASKCDLRILGMPLAAEGWLIGSDDELQDLIALLINPQRRLPVIVATGDERKADHDKPLIDAAALARATLGLAHVVILPARYTLGLTEEFGKTRSVFHGAVRTYLPGFDLDADPYAHRMVLAATLEVPEQARRALRLVKVSAANDSLRRLRLNHDVLSYSAVRSAVMRADVEKRRADGASDGDLLSLAYGEIERLERQLTEAEDWETQLSIEHGAAEERALAAEAALSAANARNDTLTKRLATLGQVVDDPLAIPSSWGDFADWCDTTLADRVVLSPSARRSVRNPTYGQVSVAARCLLWLATECRNRRLIGGGSVSEEVIEDAVRNSACGGDEYEFTFQGRKLTADWHVKSGGNTHDPARCLRIYYCWDPQSRLIVISDMPAHRTTGAS